MKELTHDKIQAEIVNTFAEIEKMRAETTKINGENRFYPCRGWRNPGHGRCCETVFMITF